MQYKVECITVEKCTGASGEEYAILVHKMSREVLDNLVENLQAEQKRRDYEIALRDKARIIAYVTQDRHGVPRTDLAAWQLAAIVEALKIDPNR